MYTEFYRKLSIKLEIYSKYWELRTRKSLKTNHLYSTSFNQTRLAKVQSFPNNWTKLLVLCWFWRIFKIFLKSQFKFHLKVLFHNHFFLQESSVSIIQGILLEKDIQCLLWMISIFRKKLPSWLKFHVVYVPQRNLCKNWFGYNLDNKVTYHTIMIFFSGDIARKRTLDLEVSFANIQIVYCVFYLY